MTNIELVDLAQFLLNKEKERLHEARIALKVGDLAEVERCVLEAEKFDKARELAVSMAKLQMGG